MKMSLGKAVLVIAMCAPSISLAQDDVSKSTATGHTISSLLANGFHIAGWQAGPTRARDVQVGYVLNSKGTEYLTGQVLLTREKEIFICAYEVLTKTVPASGEKSLSVCWEVR